MNKKKLKKKKKYSVNGELLRKKWHYLIKSFNRVNVNVDRIKIQMKGNNYGVVCWPTWL